MLRSASKSASTPARPTRIATDCSTSGRPMASTRTSTVWSRRPAALPGEARSQGHLHRAGLGHRPCANKSPDRPGQGSIQQGAVNAGGCANPDGQPGITLHVDTGSLKDAAGALVSENLGGGNDVGDIHPRRLDATFYGAKVAFLTFDYH